MIKQTWINRENKIKQTIKGRLPDEVPPAVVKARVNRRKKTETPRTFTRLEKDGMTRRK